MNKPTLKRSELMEWSNGAWALASMGAFCQMLIDQGDRAVAFRIVEDCPVTEHQFTRRMEIVCIPSGAINRTAETLGVEYFDQIIAALLAGKVTS